MESEVDQVAGAECLDDAEGGGRGEENRREAGRCCDDVEERAERQTEYRYEARPVTLAETPRDDVENGGPGNQQNHERGSDEPQQRCATRHTDLARQRRYGARTSRMLMDSASTFVIPSRTRMTARCPSVSSSQRLARKIR